MAATHSGKYLLLIDDDYTTRELTSILLAADGFRVALARNGAEALQRLRGGERPDLILLDLSMPVMDGGTFCEFLRESDRPNIPVVIVSALPDAAEQAVALGAVRCLLKPVDSITLLTTLRECCTVATAITP